MMSMTTEMVWAEDGAIEFITPTEQSLRAEFTNVVRLADEFDFVWDGDIMVAV